MEKLLALRAYAGTMLIAVAYFGFRPFATPYYEQVLLTASVMAIAATGLSILIGKLPRSGHPLLISFGHSGFLAIGAYMTTIAQREWNINFFLAMLVAIAVSVVVAVLVALPGSRMGVFGLGLVTFTLGYVIEILLEGGMFKQYTLGAIGLPARRAELLGIELGRGDGLYFMVGIVLVVGMLLQVNLTRSRFGQGLRIMGESELAATAFGVRLVRQRIVVFVIAAVYGTVAGALLVQVIGYISPDSVGAQKSVELFAMVVVGGAGTAVGAALGALFFIALPEAITPLERNTEIFFAAALLTVLVLAPTGLVGAAQDGLAYLRNMYRSWQPRAVQPPEPVVPPDAQVGP